MRLHPFKVRLQDRLAALTALRWNGSARSLEALRSIADAWYLVLFPGGMQVRAKAREAIRAVEIRLMSKMERRL